MSSNYKLTYYYPGDKAGLARLLFAIGGVKYVDDKVDKPPAHRCPISQYPTLTVDGVSFQQSSSYNRLLARRFNLAGKDDMEQTKADSIIEVLDQLEACYSSNIFIEKDGDKQKEARKKFLSNTYPKFLAILERLVGQYGSNGFSVGSGLTWADVYLYEILTGVQSALPNSLNGFPNLQNNINTVKPLIPKI